MRKIIFGLFRFLGWFFIVVGGISVGIGGIIIYVLSIIAAYMYSGLFMSILAAIFIPFSQVYWFFKIWFLTGDFINKYSWELENIKFEEQ